MNIKVLMGIVAAVIIAVAGYLLVTYEEQPKIIDPVNVVKKTVNMSGMTCRSCEIALERISENTGVVNVKASSPEQKAIVEYDKTQTDIQTIIKALEMKGYTALSYEDEQGIHEQKPAPSKAPLHEMKCGEGKCGGQ